MYIFETGIYIIMKQRGVYVTMCACSCQTDLDINVVHSTANSHNNSQSFEFFQVLKEFAFIYWKLDSNEKLDLHQTILHKAPL